MFQAGQVIKSVVEGLLDCLVEGLLGVGALKSQESSDRPYPSAEGMFFEFCHILIEGMGVSPKGLFFGAWAAVGF